MNLEIKKFTVGSFEANCYLLKHRISGNGFVIDPGGAPELIKDKINNLKMKPKAAILTHGHIDHIAACIDLNLPIWIHPEDKKLLENPDSNLSSMLGIPKVFNNPIFPLQDSSIIKLDDITLKVIHTPGHTPGSICILAQRILFTGDTLFSNGFGRTDFPYSSEKDLFESIKRLFKLDDDIKIYPGHGELSTIACEKKNLSYLITD